VLYRDTRALQAKLGVNRQGPEMRSSRGECRPAIFDSDRTLFDTAKRCRRHCSPASIA
jgi:hypothetical protein